MAELDFASRRLIHAAAYPAALKASLDRLGWDAARLRRQRTEALQALLRRARERSPWHARRLRGIDLASMTEDDLGRIPPMTKRDLMEHWDEIVTDPRLSLARCEGFLADHPDEPRDLDERYFVLASGGSSGTRGVFALDWDEMAVVCTGAQRRPVRAVLAAGHDAAGGLRVASLGSGSATHAAAVGPRLFAPPGKGALALAVDRPMGEIVERLNAHQPEVLVGYASALHLLIVEGCERHRLRIAPLAVIATSDPLLPEIARALERTFGVVPFNVYATCDAGALGASCGQGRGIHLNDDLAIVEPVDGAGRPIAAGETSSTTYVTPLCQPTLPLLRYELTDQLAPIAEPCACGAAFRRVADPAGRLDDVFSYGPEATVHPITFARPLRARPEVLEFQVRQTSDGAAIDVRCTARVDLERLRADVEEALARAGLALPRVVVREVPAIARTGAGKLKRFVALPSRP